MRTDLAFVIEEALDRLERGDKIEDILHDYPDHTAVLEPFLRASDTVNASTVAALPPELEAWLDVGRREFEAIASQEEAKRRRVPRPQLRRSWNLSPRFAGALMVCVLALLFSFQSVSDAAAQSLPGDIFYPVKLASERIQLVLTTNEAQRNALQVELMRRRVDEVDTLLMRKDADEQLNLGVRLLQDQLDTTLAALQQSDVSTRQSVGQDLAPLLADAQRSLERAAEAAPEQSAISETLEDAVAAATTLDAIVATAAVEPTAAPVVVIPSLAGTPTSGALPQTTNPAGSSPIDGAAPTTTADTIASPISGPGLTPGAPTASSRTPTPLTTGTARPGQPATATATAPPVSTSIPAATSTVVDAPAPTAAATAAPSETSPVQPPTATPIRTPQPAATATQRPTQTAPTSPSVTPVTVPQEPPTRTPVPSATPTTTPTVEPTATERPTATPTTTATPPSAEPTPRPTLEPTATPTITPTAEPTATATAEPTVTPTDEPTATPIAEPVLRPILECVIPLEEGSFIAYFGYRSNAENDTTLAIGENNRFSPAPFDRGQPTIFAPGRSPFYPNAAFSVISDVEALVWHLDGRTATATRNSEQCDDNGDEDD
ncbi:hypothetical protein HC891_05530 [Candidatus Gracilibacteria bacterium]|nr:hypothetical protein [Candidatus Gracilibacteria bacterium]